MGLVVSGYSLFLCCLCFQGEVYFSEVEKTRYVVIDEADRMIEKGHFEELSMLLEKLKRLL